MITCKEMSFTLGVIDTYFKNADNLQKWKLQEYIDNKLDAERVRI